MSQAPPISILINVFNGEAYLEQTLRSALAQTFSDFEIIVWDDASTDTSAELVRRFQDERIRLFVSPRRVSLGAARNAAIQMARGEWLAFLDQDDLWHTEKLRWQLDLAREGGPGVGLIYGRTLAFDKRGRQWDSDHRHEFSFLPQGDIYRTLFRDSCFIAMSSAMLRAEAVQALLPIPEEVEAIPDYYLYCGVARHYQARAVEQVICRYRVHAGSMTRTRVRKMQEEAVWLVRRHAGQLDEALVRDRCRRHLSVAALDQMRTRGQFFGGLARLLRDGSPLFLATRPAALLGRAIRRRISVPYWRRAEGR